MCTHMCMCICHEIQCVCIFTFMHTCTATKTMQFQPSPEVPALQYIGSVEENGAAAEAGLKAGDFLIEVCNHVQNE